MTAFPGMSKASIEGNKEEVKRLYYQNAGGLLYMLVPVMVFCFIFAEEFVTVLGGHNYAQTATIFRIFCFYGLLLPIDRLTGVALDSVNMPKQNFIKVVYMTLANIIGDGIMVFGIYYFVLFITGFTLLFTPIESIDTFINILAGFTKITILELVAVVTLLFSIIGIFVGFSYLDKEMNLRFRNIFSGGISFFSVFIKKALLKK
jgi:O-antigen/teichoic acid export membrane protein